MSVGVTTAAMRSGKEKMHEQFHFFKGFTIKTDQNKSCGGERGMDFSKLHSMEKSTEAKCKQS